MSPAEPAPTRLTVDEYFALVEQGRLRPNDRVELLEGVVVSMSPQNPPHAGTIARITALLVRLLGEHAVVRVQLPFIAGPYTVPEPDFAVVPGPPDDWYARHPDRALLVIEVADASLPTDRLSKSAIYAAAGVPQYLIVNLQGDRVEVFEEPRVETARYRLARVAARGERVALVGFPGLDLAIDDLLGPPRG